MPKNKYSRLLETNIENVIRELEASVKRNLTEGLLLSGGLDTSILAGLASRYQKPYCLTLALKGAPAPDIEYAKKVAKLFNLEHSIHLIGEEEMEEGIHKTIRILSTFDPMEVRNSAACYIGLKLVKESGLSSVMTGDGGDELFAGYSFFFDLNKAQLDAELAKMWKNMSFSSRPLGTALGIDVRLPILDPEFISLAMNLDSSFKVGKHDGQTFGKFILRQAFESILSPEIVWRTKAPLEVGTGTTTLPNFFETRITDTEFRIKNTHYLKEDRVTIRSKEHLHYYEIYREIIGIPYLSAVEGRKCPECGGNIKENTAYCCICGAYPVSG